MGVADENRKLVCEAFEPWEQGDSGPFFELISDDVDWTVIGSTPASGRFRSKQELVNEAFGPLLEHLAGPLDTRLVECITVDSRVVLRFESTGEGTNGMEYTQAYCWVMTMRSKRIDEIYVYLDTDLLRRVLAE